MIYLLDSNTLIEAKNRYYGMAVCPGLLVVDSAQPRAGRGG